MISKRKHPLDQSILYKIKGRGQLAAALNLTLNQLTKIEERLNNPNSFYHVFEISQESKSGVNIKKTRRIEVPRGMIRKTHSRIHTLLSRITPPDYLHSAIKGRSYITNARAHVGIHKVAKLDIVKFFPSTEGSFIFRFFEKVMCCETDIAALLTKMCTYDNHIPTGSPLSPILAFYAHKIMFDEIDLLSRKLKLRMTCYVDDLTFSGQSATLKTLTQIKKIIARWGLSSHKACCYPENCKKIVTGVLVCANRIIVPNRRHKNIYTAWTDFLASADETDKKKLLQKIIGRIHEAKQIEPNLKTIKIYFRHYGADSSNYSLT